MGARKRIKANQMKEARKTKAFAVLHDCPSSPQKMRLVADLVPVSYTHLDVYKRQT